MIVLGLIVALVGALVVFLGRADATVRLIGVIVAIVGLILLLIGVLHQSNAEAASFGLLAVGMVSGALHGAGDSEPLEPVKAGSVPERRPVLFAFLVSAVPVVAAFVLTILDATATEIPTWIPVLLTGLGPLLGALAALWAQAKVTPVVAPVSALGEPLVPVGAAVPGPDEEV